MGSYIAAEGIPSIDEILHQSNSTNATPNYHTVETIQVPALPSSPSPPPTSFTPARAPPPLPPRGVSATSAKHDRYYSSSSGTSTSTASSSSSSYVSAYSNHPSAMANPVDDDTMPRTRHASRPRSRSLFSFRSSRSSSSSSGNRTSLDYGDDEFGPMSLDDEDAMVAAARKGSLRKRMGKSGSKARGRSRTNSIHAAAVLPAVLVLSAECFTPSRESSEQKK